MTGSAALIVHAWPLQTALALADLRCSQACTVVRMSTPDTMIRDAARQRSRLALRELLGAFGGRPAATIDLVAVPGQPMRVDLPESCVGLSVSHAPGMSVAAVQMDGSIGVDVMTVAHSAGVASDWAGVALDYLGPQAYARLDALLPVQRAAAFSQEWTYFEAGLKCLGQALVEWTPALGQRLALCHIRALVLPAGYCGAVATRHPFAHQAPPNSSPNSLAR